MINSAANFLLVIDRRSSASFHAVFVITPLDTAFDTSPRSVGRSRWCGEQSESRKHRRDPGMCPKGQSIQSTSAARTVKQFIQIETLRSIYIRELVDDMEV